MKKDKIGFIYAVQVFRGGTNILIYQSIAENYDIALIQKQCHKNVFVGCSVSIEKYDVRINKISR